MPASARDVHIVGSVALPAAEDVFRTITASLDTQVEPLPECEIGDRRHWIQWQEVTVANHVSAAVRSNV